LLKANKSEAKLKTHFPTDMAQLRTLITKGAHSVLKNFPAPRVFEIAKHACISLKETIRIMAGLGADYNFAYNAQTDTSNEEGLNGTKAMEDR